MAGKKVAYKEPASYFNEDMRKAAKKWEEGNKKAGSGKAKQTGTKSKKK